MQLLQSKVNMKITHISAIGLSIFLMLTPFEYPLADISSISPLRIVGLLAMGLAVIDILKQKTIKIDFRVIGITLWLLYGLFTVLWTKEVGTFFSYYSIYFNNALMFLLFSVIPYNEEEKEFLKKSLIFGVLLLILYMTFVPNATIYSEFQHRLTLNAGEDGLDQNYLAALMIISFGLLFYSFINEKESRIHKIFKLFVCISIIYYIILTGSRSGLLAIILIVSFSINTTWKNRLLIGIPIVLFIFIGLPILIEYMPTELANRFSLSAITGQEAESGTRIAIWSKALESLRGFKWIFGFGIGSAQSIIGNILQLGKDMAIHNHYIATITEVGIVGFLFVNFPIYKMMQKMWNYDKAMIISFSGIAFMSIFLDVLTTKFFWSSLILLTVCYSTSKNRRR